MRLYDFATIEDLAGNALTDASATGVAEWYRFDTSAPTAVIGSTEPDPTNASPIQVTFEFSEEVTGFAGSDINVTGGSVSGLTGSTTNYTATIVPSGDGTITVDLPANVVDDLGGNSNAAAAQFTIESDRTAPTATFSALPSTQGLASTQMTLTFSETVSGLTVADFETPNLTVSNLQSTDSITYTFDVVANSDGVGSISLPAGAVQDGAGNANDAGGSLSTTDAVVSRPDVTFVDVTENMNDTLPDMRQYQFLVTQPGGGGVDEGPSFDPANVVVTNATVSAAILSNGDGSFLLYAEPTGGDVTVGFPAEFFEDDASGNLSNAIAPIYIETFDFTPPTPTISFEGYDLEDTFTARITWDEDVTDFDLSDITPVGATLGGFTTVSAAEYTVEVTAIDLTTAPSINIAADVAEDLVGNGNVAATGSTPTADGTAPTLVISGVPDGFGGPQTVTLTFDWGERVLGFEDSDIAVTGGTIGTISGGPQSWTAQFTVLGTEDVSVTVAANAVLDASGTPSAETSSSGAVETTSPTPTITYTNYDRIAPFTATITFDEDVTEFVLGDLVASSAQLSEFTAVSASVYTVTVQGLDLLTPPEISVPAGVAQDAAGNLNVAAAGPTPPAPDGVAPVVTITGVPDEFTTTQTVTITFDWGEDVIDFRDDDITVTGGTLGSISGGQQTWTASLTIDGDQNVVVAVAAGAVLDGSGTPSAAASVVGTFASGTIAEELIRDFMAARSVALLAAQPSLSGLLDGDETSGAISVSRKLGIVEIQTGGGRPIWGALNSNWSFIDGFDTAYTNLSFGSHLTLNHEKLLGLMVQFDHAVSNEGLSEIEGTGWLVGPYYVARYNDVDLDARLLWGRTHNDIRPIGTYTDSFATERLLAMINLSGEVDAGSATLHPLVGWSFTDDHSGAYIDALSNPVAAQRVRLNELEVALDWVLPIVNTGTDFIGGAAGIFAKEDGGNGVVDGGRARLDLGLRRKGHGPLDLEFGVYVDGLGQPDYDVYGVDLVVDWRF
ncbi:Ig-like domain-containing protein [Octadecabacter sp. G9-8]|uniref:Ig-like domain-containing protein n=1 Tax=Octadecabacter dasysiphoniae TaxID=2909341 RepID=A0ABS9CXR2_9RHOB|nr:Ig-like domain-containing protein [Octadecabacter dasysiphoniae]MCF2872018.1 Ig-like domain-containing protein [Octadecabacter dasysiphoniae]